MKEKKLYVVLVREHYSKGVGIWAEDEKNAAEIADALYGNGEIDLSRNAYDGYDIEVNGIARKADYDYYDQYSVADVYMTPTEKEDSK